MRHDRLFAAAILGLAAATCGDPPPPVSKGLTPEQAAKLVSLENRGIGSLERYDYTDALPLLREASDLAPTWVTGRFNLALGLIHAGRENPAEAAKILDAILKEAPDHPHANFMSAWLAERAGGAAQESATLYMKDGRKIEGEIVKTTDAEYHVKNVAGETAVLKRADVERLSQSALALYAKAYRLTGRDPVVGAKYGGLLARIDGKEKEALKVLEECYAKRPTLISPVYQLMLLSRQLGDEAKGKEYLTRFEALKGKVREGVDRATVGQDIQDAYGNMGTYSMAIREFAAPPGYPAPPVVDVTASPPADLGTWKAGALPKYAPFLGAAVFDFDQDGDLDLFVCGGEGPCALLRNDGGLKFADVAAEAGVAVKGVYTVAAGEFDVAPAPSADSKPCRRAKIDLVLVRDEGLTFLRNLGDGKFADATKESGLSDDPGGARAALAFDADQEGDLDLFLSGGHGQRNRLWANAGPGKFTEVSESAGVMGDFKSYGPAAVLDFDDDYDLDLLVTRPEAPPVLYANDRAMKFHQVAMQAELPVSPYGVTAWGDRVVLQGDAGATWLRSTSRATVEGHPVERAPGGLSVSVDARGAGARDLVFADGTWMPAASGFGASPFEAPKHLFDVKPGANILAFDADGDGTEEIVLVRPLSAPQVVRLTAAPHGNALVCDFEGVIRNDVQAGWSNLEGRGALVEVKAGPSLSKFRLGNPSGFGCAGPTRLVTGLGTSSQADFVRIVWPDAVQHAVLNVPGGQLSCIVEEQRRPDSCPLLFSWDGEKYAFVTDFLGIGGIGFLVAPGVYGAPDPTESVKVDAALVKPRKDGKLSFRLPEAMEEVVYLDRADLQVVDHPEAVTVYPDERFAGERPFPNGDLIAYRREILPASARDEFGSDVTERVLAVDRRYPDAFKLHPRLLGAVAEQSLELDFGDRLAEVKPGDPLVLYLNGWIEYGYTRTTVAAAGEGFAYVGPLLEAWSAAEKTWKTLAPNMGYPAGFPRVMTYDVTGKVSRDTPRLRIRTNYEIYWDRVWLARKADAAQETRVTVLDPVVADLRWVGYPREYSPDGRTPRIYDYQTMDPSMPWKTMEGDYTRFGDVKPLLAKADDEFVVYGKGEEIELLFDPAGLPPLPAGWTRSYVLRFDGYCKGQELYTAHGWTVEPLPFHAMTNYPYGANEHYPDDEAHRKYRAEWNTRRVRGVAR